MEILFWGLGFVGFWVFLGLVTVILFALVEGEKPGWATLTILATLAFFQFGTGFKPFTLFGQHVGWGILAIVGYFIAGTAWCIGKWYFYVKADRRRYEEAKQAFVIGSGYPDQAYKAPVPPELQAKWEEQMRYSGWHLDRSRQLSRPRAKGNKSRIMMWLVYWPWSFVWTMINDPVKKAFRAIYDSIKATLDAISKKAFAGTENDFSPTPPPAPKADDGDRDIDP